MELNSRRGCELIVTRRVSEEIESELAGVLADASGYEGVLWRSETQSKSDSWRIRMADPEAGGGKSDADLNRAGPSFHRSANSAARTGD